MPWEARMRWRDVATVTVLQQGDTLRSMGSKEIMLEQGQDYKLVETAYRRMLNSMADGNLE
jgi:hypothetical protein